MKREMIYMFWIFFVFILSGCVNNSNEISEEASIEIDIGSLGIKEFPGNRIKDLKYIKLETNEACLIRHIDKMILRNELIYILDRISKTIYVFNLEGEYLKKYYHYGKGPGEYINLGDFDISIDGKFIFFLDYTQYKICKYTLDNAFINEQKLDFGTSSFACIEDNLLIFYQKNRMNTGKDLYNNNLVYFNYEKNKPLKGYFPTEDPKMVIGNYALYRSEDQLYFCPYSTNAIYKVSKDGIAPFISLSGVNAIDDEIWKIENPKIFLHSLLESEAHISFRNFYILNDIITFSYSQQHTKFTLFYSMKKGKLIYGNGIPITDPNRIPGSFNIIGIYNDHFISYFMPTAIMKNSYEIFPSYKNYPKIHADLIDLSKHIAVSDNPILVFFKIDIN